MTNEIATTTTSAITKADRAREREHTKVDRPIQFLKLLATNAKECSDEDFPEARPGNFLFGGTKILKEIRVIPEDQPARFHASMLDENDDTVCETYVDGDETWKRVSAVVKSKNKNGMKARCGLELLCWVPDQKAYTVVSFMNTARPEANFFLDARDARKLVGLKSKKIVKGNTWFIPKGFDCGKAEANLPLPTVEQRDAAIEAFWAPTKEETAPADDGPPR